MFTITLRVDGPVHLHLHDVRSEELLARVTAIGADVGRLLVQGAHMTTQAQQIQDLLQRVFDNTNAEAAVNVRQTAAIDMVQAKLAALTDQVKAGTPGITQEEAATFIAQLNAIDSTLERVKGDEQAQADRLEQLGAADSPIPDPIAVPAAEPVDPVEE